jgi:DNA-binding transcriptional LysR family regulator
MLDKLEFMLALAREKHFRRAADSCGVAQPTLSLGIRSLEEMLNVPLVRRSSRFQGFTPEGERVLMWARRMVGDAHAMRQELNGLKLGVGAHIRLAAIPSAMSIVSSLTTPFHVRNPNARFTVLTRPADVVVNLLHHRDIDIGIAYIDNDPIDDVLKVPLFREEYLLLTTKSGPLGNTQRVTWAEAARLPLCALTRDFQHRRIMDSALQEQNIELVPSMETDSEIALASHVRTGRWSSIVRRSMTDLLDLSGELRAIPLTKPSISRTIGLIVSRRFVIQPTIASLIDEARLLTPPELVAAE